MLVHDPQTSGGLLLAMDAAAASRLLTALPQHGYLPQCRVIGQIHAGDPGIIRLG